MAATPGIEWKRLSLREALDLAVAIEEEARDRYREFAEQLTAHHTAEAAGFFERMARIEEIHRSQLAARREELFPGEPPGAMRERIYDVEAPEYDAARAFMSVREALEAALSAEEKAYAFFVRAIPQLENNEVRALFGELRDEEVEHQDLVKAEIARLAAEPGGGDEAYSDDPVAQ
ncbi:MAG TPA: ferritin family protein [Myxococcaceae bacterium]|nr:ferritin family protein [Myxococcaceae bacterium]